MNTKNNQRTRLSKILLKNALMDLLSEKGSVTKISVRELCERADLNRSTFCPSTPSRRSCRGGGGGAVDATREHLQKIGAENDIGAHRYLLSFLIYIKENDKPFRTLLIDAGDPEFRSKFMQQSIIQFVENLNISFPKDQEQYIYSYILNGSTGVIIQWMRSDYSIDENALVDLLFFINQSALVNLATKKNL